MQAIILAAGMGKRLKELTQNNTKCMVRVDGVTLIERMLRQIERQKVSRIIIVIGYEGEKLKDYITNGQKILSVRAITGTDEMDKVFETHHITCNKMTLYDSVGTLTYHTDIINSCNCIVFASASGVRRFFEELAHQKIVLNDHIDFICIGKVTADELTKHGISKHITADIHNVDGIIKELERRYEI